MLTAKIIRKWLELRGGGSINEHGIASLAQSDPEVDEAWGQSTLIDDLIGSARVVKKGLASQSFADKLNARIVHETDGPDAARAIWDAAK